MTKCLICKQSFKPYTDVHSGSLCRKHRCLIKDLIFAKNGEIELNKSGQKKLLELK